MRAGYLVEALSLPAPARSPGTSVEVLPSVRAAVCWPELLCLPWRVSAVRHRPLAAARGRRTVHGRTMPGANALECSMLTRSSLPLAVCSLFGRRSFFSLPRRQLTVKALWSSLAALACAVNMAAAREDWLPSRQRHSPASLENHVDARAVAGCASDGIRSHAHATSGGSLDIVGCINSALAGSLRTEQEGAALCSFGS